jgi:hypothetical protein
MALHSIDEQGSKRPLQAAVYAPTGANTIADVDASALLHQVPPPDLL